MLGNEHQELKIADLTQANLELRLTLRDLVARLTGLNDIGLRGMSRSQIIAVEAAKALLARSS